MKAGGVLCPAPRKHGGIRNRSAPAGGCWRRRGREGGAAVARRVGRPPRASRPPPAGRAPTRRCGLRTTHTHIRTHSAPAARASEGRGPAASQRVGGNSAGARAASRRGARPLSRPISAPGGVPRALGPPRADSRDSGGGARPAREEADGEWRVPGPGRVFCRGRCHRQHRARGRAGGAAPLESPS